MNLLEILNADYMQCVTHQENMIENDEVKTHSTKDCFMIPMNFTIHKTRKFKKNYLPANVIEAFAMIVWKGEDEDLKQMEYTIPTGHIIITGDLDEFIKMGEAAK